MGKAFPYPGGPWFGALPCVSRRSSVGHLGPERPPRSSQLQGSGFYAPPYASPRFTRSWPWLP